MNLYYFCQVFLHTSFNLEDPATFSTVLPWSSIDNGKRETPTRPMSPKHSRKLLQEKVDFHLNLALRYLVSFLDLLYSDRTSIHGISVRV